MAYGNKMPACKTRAIQFMYIFVLQVVLSISTDDTITSATEKLNHCSALVSDKHCHCNPRLYPLFIECSRDGLSITSGIREMYIHCDNQTENMIKFVPNFNLFIEELYINSCMLLEFSNFPQKFNITNLKHLTIENCIQGNKSLLKLDAKLFGEINTLESLTIANSTIFSEDLFKKFPKLKILRLVFHEIRKMGYFFENNLKLEALELFNNHLEILSDNVFEKLYNLLQLDLSWNNLTRITRKYFRGLKHLKSLDLSVNYIRQMEENAFSDLGDLVNIKLSYNNLTRITQKYFSGLKCLKSLDLEKNCIRHIEENAFSDLEDLVDINLKSNQLGNISSNIFKNNKKLETVSIDGNQKILFPDYIFANLEFLKSINMSNNKLENILAHTFENCTNLTILEMQNNNFKNLPSDLFKTLRKIVYINLSKNKFEFVSLRLFWYLENLEVLNLEGNSITKLYNFPPNANTLRNLRVLQLQWNNLTYFSNDGLAFLQNLMEFDLSYNQLNGSYNFLFDFIPDSLQKINLSHNKISSISPEHIYIEYPSNLVKIDLSYNSLTEINLTEFRIPSLFNVDLNLANNHISHINLNFTAAQKITGKNLNNKIIVADITNNPLICDCRNYEFFEYLQHTDRNLKTLKSRIIFTMTNMTCSEPKKFEYISIENLSLQQLTCEDIQDCTSKCTCFRRPYDNVFVVDCSFRNLENPPILSIKHARLEIVIAGNLLRTGPKEGEGYENVTILDLSRNELVSFDWCPPNIEKLNLSYNYLKMLSPKVLNVINSSSKFSLLTLGKNPWTCDCSALDLRNFIQTHLQKIDFNNALCEDDKNAIYKVNDLCKPKFTTASLMLVIFLIISTISTVFALYFKYKQEIKIWLFSKNCCLWLVFEEDLDKDKIYDIFLCFSHKDEDFVIKSLVPPLEKSFKLCIHSRDWIPGELINHQIVHSVYNSRRTVVVLSNDFLESAWGRLEFLLAHKQSLEEGRPRVIVIKLRDLNEDKLDDEYKAYMKTNTYVEWGERWFWKKLIYSLPHSGSSNAKINQEDLNHISDVECHELIKQ